MIPHGVEVFVALSPVDMRWSFDRLAGAVEAQLGRAARCGALFVFFGKRRTAVKVLFYDGSGMCLFYKRLDQGTFRMPESSVTPGCARSASGSRCRPGPTLSSTTARPCSTRSSGG